MSHGLLHGVGWEVGEIGLVVDRKLRTSIGVVKGSGFRSDNCVLSGLFRVIE